MCFVPGVMRVTCIHCLSSLLFSCWWPRNTLSRTCLLTVKVTGLLSSQFTVYCARWQQFSRNLGRCDFCTKLAERHPVPPAVIASWHQARPLFSSEISSMRLSREASRKTTFKKRLGISSSLQSRRCACLRIILSIFWKHRESHCVAWRQRFHHFHPLAHTLKHAKGSW